MVEFAGNLLARHLVLTTFLVFVVWELTDERAIVDLRVFKGRNFLGGTIAISFGRVLYFSNLVVLPRWIHESFGDPAVDAGLIIAPLDILAIFIAPVLGKIMPKSDPRVLRHSPSSALRTCS